VLNALSNAWWVFLVRGIAAVALGLSLWLQPAASLAVLVLFFGAWMLVDGIFTAVGAIAGRGENPEWGWMLVYGLLGAVLGGLTLHAPGHHRRGSGALCRGLGHHGRNQPDRARLADS
jgi:uncharacterized membrane protein HdeD (DUF308 family)